MNQSSSQFLSFFSCLVVNIPDHGSSKGKDCVNYSDSLICIQCDHQLAGFLGGEDIEDVEGTGHLICFVMWIIIVIVGSFGFSTNILIILVIRGKGKAKGSHFHFLVGCLAVFDTLNCTFAILGFTSFITCYEGWSNCGSYMTTNWIHITNLIFFFTRSLSCHMTVVITIYSYLGIIYPLRSREWFTWRRVKLFPLAVIMISIIFNIPRVGTPYVSENILEEQDIIFTSIRGYKYLSLMRLWWYNFWYEKLFAVHDQLDFVLPLPLLMAVNIMSYRTVKKLGKVRKQLTLTQASGVQPVKMFIPVVTFLLVSNVIAMAGFVMAHINGVLYREVYLASLLWCAFNSSPNFVIYYVRGSQFREDTRKFFGKLARR
ncbi:unnamed protein product [Orchesella dallaii]|uniref:G-protein coupled receptors family 1 profile domain-containing protein n=1 Tax=Orchesella dallaii TaxID=48710 RepID=A0ABP1QIX8_9HEXA